MTAQFRLAFAVIDRKSFLAGSGLLSQESFAEVLCCLMPSMRPHKDWFA
ncbi:hypothetical protein QUB80_19265 [Chlorogloeopsis sp. ULAP01]|nr:hypothetical protein [Chlorogloeopsis sp. ULAP01]MDM9382836.1 hypothetical protein [Chlorogloeopsis sp. ULAP01]